MFIWCLHPSLSALPQSVNLSILFSARNFAVFSSYIVANMYLLYSLILTSVDRVSTTETVDFGSIPGLVKPKAISIGIHSFSARRSTMKGRVWRS